MSWRKGCEVARSDISPARLKYSMDRFSTFTAESPALPIEYPIMIIPQKKSTATDSHRPVIVPSTEMKKRLSIVRLISL